MKSGKKSASGFTLIEALLSLTVMTVLFGASLKVYRYFQHRTSSARASEEIFKIRKIFENYFDTYGYWPKGIFPVGKWFDLSREESDFKAVFSGKNKRPIQSRSTSLHKSA